ncbi:MAG: hypothetical protein ACJ0Q6_05560 [Candidatus Azotimanducaceae bacterium]|nr:hypothetical protein [Gammaproteobacteria bacterium]OUV67023.1 MAG: hypothetical protein CBC93_06890 [Gammaproteobacteria bacterium TMED133]
MESFDGSTGGRILVNIGPQELNQERLDFLMSLGVEAIEIRLSSNEASREYLEKIIDGLKGTGLELHEIMLENVYNSTSAALDLPQ